MLSSVDNSVAPGIGTRQDGWPNLDLAVGTIVSLTPGLPDELRAVYTRRWENLIDLDRHMLALALRWLEDRSPDDREVAAARREASLNVPTVPPIDPRPLQNGRIED